ncbi:uncharacterized protein LOC132313513 [Cornus florida]|uniref:uncharacterized protein LOC132313513 n=1 Tax=Cornus florida TaxID=4283 RepID=UPI00289B6B76|nr:uncharacterized protein LOC132313513 [Cornus florida]
MDSAPPRTDNDIVSQNEKGAYTSMVDPFLVEALQNPRHRLTILRMELEIQKFLQNSDQQQFEFQHFPTSYLRLAAHRVAQHYGLQSMVLDNVLDGLGTRIMVRKMTESKYPSVCLSEIPAKQPDSDTHKRIKIVSRPRLDKASSDEANELGIKRNPVRTVEERKEDYDRARARIFSNSSSRESEDTLSQDSLDGKILSLSKDENGGCRNCMVDSEKILCVRDGGTSSQVAIFRDREKDRTDPDYDRRYERYVRSIPANQSESFVPFNMQNCQPPFVQYDAVFPQMGQMPRTHGSISYSTPVMSPFCTMGHQTSRNPVYMQLPNPAVMYAQSYDQLRYAFFQAHYCQQPLSFDYSQTID